jgi:formylglycine-generating enzyme required for sulfatase activity
MSGYRLLFHALLSILCVVGIWSSATAAQSLQAQNEALLQQLQRVHDLSDAQVAELRALFTRARYMGQGNPAITEHPATPAQCQARLDDLSVSYENPEFERICGAKYMAPLYQTSTEHAQDADVCIDQFEFPNIPCDYPVVWVRAREAAQICSIMGKRLCDAHEWEGACAGSLEAPDYRFDLATSSKAGPAVKRMRQAHNAAHQDDKSWSYGPAYQRGVCAASSHKSRDCDGGNWAKCGSNTFPSGHFPACRSSLGVYDLNGNAAEHMNLPLNAQQMSSRGSTTLGYTEMKGSWFIFDTYRAHPDWCRWRAPFWHGSRVMDEHSHHNYHLGFRCCKTIAAD